MPKLSAATDHRPTATLKTSTPSSSANPIWVSVSEAAKLGGVQTKTIRRAISAGLITYHIRGNRYLIDFGSLLNFLRSRTKLNNKLQKAGLGQYVETWIE
jgi:excisionase family DNA binding protein